MGALWITWASQEAARPPFGQVCRAPPSPARGPVSALFGRFPARAPTLRILREQLVPHPVQICEGEEREDPRRVVVQPALAHLGEAPLGLDDMEWLLHHGPNPRTALVDGIPAKGTCAALVLQVTAAAQLSRSLSSTLC